MDIYRRLEKEKKYNIRRLFIPIVIMSAAGYFVYALIDEGFFVGWEVYFAVACYIMIFTFVFAIDMKVMWWINYRIHITDGKVKIRDGFFSRVISIPLERLYYISSVRIGNEDEYDSIFITDKKINHSKIKLLTESEFKDESEHLSIVRELEDRYPEKSFYYYRVCHNGYKFLYYFYMLYRSCDRCRFSSTSMELVKGCIGMR
jgi:Predicted membrane protein